MKRNLKYMNEVKIPWHTCGIHTDKAIFTYKYIVLNGTLKTEKNQQS